MTFPECSNGFFRAQRVPIAGCMLLLVVAAIAPFSHAEGIPVPPVSQMKPYRALIVAQNWSDPNALVINSATDKFQPVAALLKAWSVPFDILLLDQQPLDNTYLFRRSRKIRYGAIIWLADPPSYAEQNLSYLEAATRAGTSLIVIGSRFLSPALNQMLGLRFKEFYTSQEPFRIARDHYIVRGIAKNDTDLRIQGIDSSGPIWVQPTGAEVLITQGQHPVLTVNQIVPGVFAVWLGPSTVAALRSSVFWRNLFFRSLVWSLGYVVVPNVDYAHRVILELDDWGTADKGFLAYWHYLEPREETLQQYFIRPLQQHHAVASAMVDTGYVDRQSQRIVSPWTQKFTDLYGLHQDYASTRRGLKDALAAGVLNIESHGWTHMQPDLESPPGPWWTAELPGEGSMDGWYTEFRDRRRNNEVPAVAQLYHMQRSLEELQQDFGVQPLELKPGGAAWSKSPSNNTAALAARVGFGLFHGDKVTYYLDRRLVLDMAGPVLNFDMYNLLAHTGYNFSSAFHPERWPAHPDGPAFLGFHDKDIAMDHNFLEQIFAALPQSYRTMAANRYIGILHTEIGSSTSQDGFQLTFTQDKHYCAYFADHPSSWRLWLSDPLREQLAASHLEASVDDKASPSGRSADFMHETLIIDLPPGTGTHTWKLQAAKNSQ